MKLSSEFRNFLAQETSGAERLCDILKSEREALANNELDSLHDLSEKKQAQAEALRQLDMQRNAWLVSQGFSADVSGIKHFLAETDDETKLAWEGLKTQLSTCQQQNRMNGNIVDKLQRKIRTTLAILQGKPDDTDTYGKSGKTVSDSATNILTRA
jgi:flagellar biosynthesis/type III secretory pathway chaperone